MSGAAIAARGVTKRFGRAAALRDLELEVAPGTSLVLLGPNGAGKSTLLRLIAGLSRPSEGSLEIDGRPAHHRETRARLGYVGHATLLSPSLTVRENLIFAGRLQGLPSPRSRADERLEREGIGALAERPAAELSRGQAQRVAIARALIHDPALVLLDEPFTGLDGGAAERLVERLSGLRTGGCTTVLATHALDSARALADRALVLASGRCTWSGPVSADTADLEAALAAALGSGERAA